MPKKRPHDDRSIRRTRDDERRAQKLSQLQARLLRSLRKHVRGIKRMDQITHDNVHLIHDRMEVIREQIQELMSHHGDDGILEFKGVDLHKANLIGADFDRMDLEGANLEGSFGGNFGHVNLQQANLRNSRITDLGYANLTGAHLENADLHECCLLGARLDGANLSGANLCGAELLHIQAVGAVWDGARFDAKTRFSPDFDLPAELVWTGPGTDPRTKTSSRTRAAAKRKTPKKKAKAASKPVARRKRVAASADLSLKCLLTDRQLTKLCSGLVQDAALPDGINVEDMDHPIYGPDLQFSIALEYCPNRFRDLDLTAEEFDFNVWYRAERFARLFDAAEDGYCDGNHDRAERLMPDVSGELFGKAYRRIQREVGRIMSSHATTPGKPTRG